MRPFYFRLFDFDFIIGYRENLHYHLDFMAVLSRYSHHYMIPVRHRYYFLLWHWLLLIIMIDVCKWCSMQIYYYFTIKMNRALYHNNNKSYTRWFFILQSFALHRVTDEICASYSTCTSGRVEEEGEWEMECERKRGSYGGQEMKGEREWERGGEDVYLFNIFIKI